LNGLLSCICVLQAIIQVLHLAHSIHWPHRNSGDDVPH